MKNAKKSETGKCIYEDSVKASNHFSLDIYKETSKIEKGNVLACPLSLEFILAVTSTGSYGETQEEIIDTLHLPNEISRVQSGFKSLLSTIDKSNVVIATQLFIGSEYQIDQKFAKQADENFQSGVQNVDFQNSPRNAVQAINSFISEKTNGKIQEIVQIGAIDQSTKLLLINTLYFKAKWASPFKKDMTRTGAPFYLSNDKKKTAKVDLMYQAGSFKYSNVEELGCDMIELPFESNKYKMVIILPKEIEGLSELESTMKEDPNFFQNFDDLQTRKVEITLPKMKVLVNTDFKDVLKKLGVQKVFHQSADMYGIVENDIGKLKVDSVVQKVFFNVDEDGAEAAAATSTSVSQRRGADDIVIFTADHPFLFAIVQTSNNLVVFQGRFNKPA
uniref:Serpin domain-containing protein n=1 Tax=Clastoptera arizonana TaxID=38151 RepID=A0A1B6E0Z1_9HEMI